MPSPADKIGSLAVIGARGLLGSSLCRVLGGRYDVAAIDKENYDSQKGKAFNVIVNANGNSRRFWANENPPEDFAASTLSVHRSLFDFSCGRYVYVSSSDVYEGHANPAKAREDSPIEPLKLSPYGFHKYLSEQLVRRYARDFLIARSSALLGPGLKKGPIYDILSGNPLRIAIDSEIQFITAQAFAEALLRLLDLPSPSERVVNIGGRGTFGFAEAAALFRKPLSFEPRAERQRYEMNVDRLGGVYPVKTSKEYVEDFLKEEKPAV